MSLLTVMSLLRRLMRNELDQQVRKVAQRSAKGVVDALAAGVRGDLRCQTSQQPTQRLRTVTLQSEEVFELAYDPFYDLALSRRPSAIRLRRSAFGHALRESFLGVAATSAPYRSIQSRSHSTPVKPLSARRYAP